MYIIMICHLVEAKIGDSIINENFRYEVIGYKIVPSKYIETAEGLQKVIAINEKDYNEDIWNRVEKIHSEE